MNYEYLHGYDPAGLSLRWHSSQRGRPRDGARGPNGAMGGKLGTCAEKATLGCIRYFGVLVRRKDGEGFAGGVGEDRMHGS